jgi:peptidoglycan hydrolase-like protein with peptidoglycan-binding domain
MLKTKIAKVLAFSFMAAAMIAPGSAFALIDEQLDFGERGAEVTELQTFLAQYPTIYPEGLITGYFGPLTQAAVKRFQCQFNIVCSGTPSTTGYGRVGPTTRATINNIMTGGTGGPIPDVNSPIMSAPTIITGTSTTTISWTTDEDAWSRVMYSTTFPFLYATASTTPDPTIDKTSIVNLTGLNASTTYYYTRESRDFYSNVTWSLPSATFQTQP